MEILPLLVQIFVSTAGASIVVAIITAYSNRKKVKAEATNVNAAAELALANKEVSLSAEARALLGEVRIEAREAKLQSARCELKIRALQAHIDKLEKLLYNNNIIPPAFVWDDNLDGTN